MEIYNEKVRDLLEEKSSTQNTVQLKVREHPKSGPYVQGITSFIFLTIVNYYK
jgi:hypothetical protein